MRPKIDLGHSNVCNFAHVLPHGCHFRTHKLQRPRALIRINTVFDMTSGV